MFIILIHKPQFNNRKSDFGFGIFSQLLVNLHRSKMQNHVYTSWLLMAYSSRIYIIYKAYTPHQRWHGTNFTNMHNASYTCASTLKYKIVATCISIMNRIILRYLHTELFFFLFKRLHPYALYIYLINKLNKPYILVIIIYLHTNNAPSVRFKSSRYKSPTLCVKHCVHLSVGSVRYFILNILLQISRECQQSDR